MSFFLSFLGFVFFLVLGVVVGLAIASLTVTPSGTRAWDLID